MISDSLCYFVFLPATTALTATSLQIDNGEDDILTLAAIISLDGAIASITEAIDDDANDLLDDDDDNADVSQVIKVKICLIRAIIMVEVGVIKYKIQF